MASTAFVGNVSRISGSRNTLKNNYEFSFEIAAEYRYHNGTTWVTKTTFHTVLVYNDLGRNVANTFARNHANGIGMRLLIAGNLRKDKMIVADHIGPELRWAIAAVVKTDPTPDDDAPAADTGLQLVANAS